MAGPGPAASPAERVSPRARLMWLLGALLRRPSWCSRSWWPPARSATWSTVPWWALALLGVGAGGVRRGGAAVALRGAPLGGHRHRGLHPDRLVGRASAGSRRCRGSRPSTTPRARSRGSSGWPRVTVTTASAAGALEIAGLDRARARELVDELTLQADAVRGRRHVSADAELTATSSGSGSTRGCCWSTRSASWSASCRCSSALFVAGTAAGRRGDWWQLLGVAIPMALGVLRYLTTCFRITDGRVELRRGLLNRHVLSTPLDRVRTVDLTASPIHRLLGLTTVRIGTGTASTDEDDALDLDGLPVEPRPAAARGAAARLAPTADDRTGRRRARATAWSLRLRPGLGPVRAADQLRAGARRRRARRRAARLLNTLGWLGPARPGRVVDGAAGWSAGGWRSRSALVVLAGRWSPLLAIGGYVVTNWGFTLTPHRPRRVAPAPRPAHHPRDHARRRPGRRRQRRASRSGCGWPAAAGSSAIVTGLDRKQPGSALLVPPAPRAAVGARSPARCSARAAPVDAPLTGHGPRARRRRYTRALGAGASLVAAALVAARRARRGAPPGGSCPRRCSPAGRRGARRRPRARPSATRSSTATWSRRSGSLDRRRDALATDGVIGWNLRSTWFQRRAGLTTLVATTAGGRQSVTVLDVPEDAAVAARRAGPCRAWSTQFLVVVAGDVTPDDAARTRAGRR